MTNLRSLKRESDGEIFVSVTDLKLALITDGDSLNEKGKKKEAAIIRKIVDRLNFEFVPDKHLTKTRG